MGSGITNINRILTSSGAKTSIPKNSAVNPALLKPETLFNGRPSCKPEGPHAEG
jgi:hypothetical protein